MQNGDVALAIYIIHFSPECFLHNLQCHLTELHTPALLKATFNHSS